MIKDIKQTIKRAKAGDKKAFEKLYKETYDRNYYIIFKMLNNEQDTLDVLQETYIKVFVKLDQYIYKGPESFPAWTGKVASNTALDFLRRKNPILFTEMEQFGEDGTVEFDIEDRSEQYRPEIVYDKKETAEIVEKMLDCLSEEQRICILLFYLQEMSIKEIAQICNCSENTIKSRLHYGRKKIYEQGEMMKKRGITLMGITPFTLLLYALKQDAAATKAPVIAAEISREIMGTTMMHLETANKAVSTATAIGKSSFIAQIGAGKLITIVAAGSLGVGLTAGIVIGRHQSPAAPPPATEQVTTTEVVTTTEEETTEITTEISRKQTTTTEEVSEMQTTTEKPATEKPTTEKKVTTTEKSTEKKTTAGTKDDSVEWDDDYIEWDE